MTEGKIRWLKCKQCKAEFTQGGRGRTKFYCSPQCKAKAKYEGNKKPTKEE